MSRSTTAAATPSVMDQVSDPKSTDERWMERIALKDALKRLNPPGAP